MNGLQSRDSDHEAAMRYERHPRNIGFEWRQPDPPFRRLSIAEMLAYGDNGFVAVRDAFSAQEMAAVIAAIDPLEAQTEAFLRTRDNGTLGIARAGEITFRPHLVTQSAELRVFSRHPVLLDLCHDLIGPNVRLYWDQSVYKKPEADKEFPWHQDNGYTYIEPQQYLTCWIALTDATIDNGCPWVVPGLHRLGTLQHRWTPLGFQCLDDVEGAVAVEAEAGSIVVFSSLTPHRTGPNVTAEVRKSYILQYAADGAIAYPQGKQPARCDAPDRQYLVLHEGNPV
jgi:ectoine hydroxylase-related dioxygenase (phytanoyl-CoA dioxygenase family)